MTDYINISTVEAVVLLVTTDVGDVSVHRKTFK